MNAALVIVLPFGAGMVTYMIGGKKPLSHFLAATSFVATGLLVTQIPIDQPVSSLGFYLTLSFLGRLILLATLAIGLIMIIHSWEVPQTGGFVSCLCFVVGSIMAAQLGENLFLTAAFLQLAALSITFVIPSVPPTRKTILVAGKYLSMVALSGFLILGALLMIEGLDISKDTVTLARTALALLAAGIGILTAVAPLHLWLPDIGEQASSMVTAVLVCLMSIAATSFLVGLMDRFTWLLADSTSVSLLQVGAAVTTLLGAALALAQNRLGKIVAYTAIHSIGFVLLGLTFTSGQVVMATIYLILTQSVTLFLLLLATSYIVHVNGDDRIGHLQGVGKYSPIPVLAILIGGLAISGYPLFAGFAGRWLIYLAVAETNVSLAVILLAGAGLLLITYIRAFHGLYFGQPSGERKNDNPILSTYAILFVVTATGVLGVFPDILYDFLGEIVVNLSFVKLV